MENNNKIENNSKKILIIFGIITSVLVLVLTIVSTWFGIYASRHNDNSHQIIQRNTSKNFLLEDAISKTNNDNADNVSLFFVERSGAFIVTQTLIDILLQSQLYPEKEIYVAFSNETLPDVDDGAWPRDINWELVVPEDHLVNFSDGDDEADNKSISNAEMDMFINDYLSGDTDVKIDLYLDSYSYFEHQKDDFISEFGNSLKYLDSLTFFTDGTALFAVEEEMQAEYSKYSTNDKLEMTENIEKLVSGEITSSDLSNNEIKDASRYMYAANPKNLEINVLGLSSDVYKAHENVLSASGPGLETARRMLTEESKDLMKQVVNLDQYDIDKGDSQVGKTNFVISGNLVKDNDAAMADAEMITETYNEILEKGEYDMSNINILYKPHPRSEDVNLDTMVSYVSDLTGTDATSWVQIIPKEIQFEFYVLSGEFDDDETTNTDYQLYLTGTSTIVPAAYDSGITSDDIEKYYTTPDGLATMHEWYDGTGIIDWTKVEVQ